MKNFICLLGKILLLVMTFSIVLPAQGTKIGTRKINSRPPQQNFGVDNHFLLREADRQLRMLDFEQAYLTLDNAVAQDPQSVDALVQRAKYNRMLGRTAEADADIRLVNRMNPYAADLYGFNGPQGILNLIAFQPEHALLRPEMYQLLPAYHKMLDLPLYYGNDQAEEYVHLSEILAHLEEGLLEEAVISVQTLIAEYPELGLAYELKGMIHIQQKEYTLAAGALAQAAAWRPESPTLWYNYSQLERDKGQYSLAKNYIDRAIELQSDFSAAYFVRAGLHKILGDTGAALDDYNQIIDFHGADSLEALFNRGLTRKMMGDFRGALADLNLVLNALPDEADLYKNRANLYLLFGYTNRAIQDYTQAIEQETGFAEAYYNRGLAHFLLYDPISGCNDLQKSADLGFEPAEEKQRFFCRE